MGATKHKCVDSFGNHRIEIARDCLVGELVVEQAFFDQRYKQRTSLTGNAHVNVERAECVVIGPAANGRAGSDDTDVAVTGGRDRRLSAWLNHAHYRDFYVRPQFRN